MPNERRVVIILVATKLYPINPSSSSHTMNRTIRLNKIAVAVSGGVDSSVAAYLLKQTFAKSCNINQNYIFGLHMSNWNASDEDSQGNYCEQSEKMVRGTHEMFAIDWTLR